MSKKSGPTKQNSFPHSSSPAINIEKTMTGFFDLPPDPSETPMANQSHSAPNKHTGMMLHAKSLARQQDDDDNHSSENSEELPKGPHWFTLPPLPQKLERKITHSAQTEYLLTIIDGFIQSLDFLQDMNSNLSTSAAKVNHHESQQVESRTSGVSHDASNTLLTRQASFNKKGSKAEIISTMKTKILVLLASREESPENSNDENLAKNLHTIFQEGLANLNKRVELNKDKTNMIKSRIQHCIDELKPFISPSSAPTSARSSYRN